MGSSLSTPLSARTNTSTLQQQQHHQQQQQQPPQRLGGLSLLLSQKKALCDAAPPPPPPLPPVGGGSSSSAPPPPPPLPPAAQSSTTTTTLPPPPPVPTTPGKDGGGGEQQQQQTADDSIARAASMASAIANPGPFDQASLDSRRLLMLDTFDGFRCDISKQLTPFMLVVHSFQLGFHEQNPHDGTTTNRSTYSFVGQVADEQGIFMTRVDPGRQAVDGRLQRMVLGGNAMAKLQVGGVLPPLAWLDPAAAAAAEEDGNGGGGQNDQLLAELDFGGQSWTANVKYGSMGGAPLYGCNYFQAITPRVAMGAEGMYVGASQNPLLSNYTLKFTIPARTGDEDISASSASSASVAAITAAAAQAGGGEFAASSSFCLNYNAGQGAMSINYARVVTPRRVTLGAELQFSPFNLESNLLLGAEFQLSRSKLQFAVDGTGRIQSLLETKLGGGAQQGGPKLQFSSDVNHFKEEMKFGFGLNIEG